MEYSLNRYLKVGAGYAAKGNLPRAERQFQEIRKTAESKQGGEPGKEKYWQEVKAACEAVLKQINSVGDDPDYPELGREVKEMLETRLDRELPDIKEKHLAKGRRKSERKSRQERMQNRDVTDLLGGKSPPPSRFLGREKEDIETGISYRGGVGQEEKTVDEDSTAEVVQDRIEFLEEEVRKSQEDLIELKQ
ncbi:MAG: hypothetical protein ABEJ03_03820, partial [Candidatus Nanohaloarchaea archaeon]